MIGRLDNPVRRYAWGSVDALPRLLGVPPDGEPQAELWLGAHERATSTLCVGGERVPLLEVVRDDPQGELGPDWAAGARLPYLAKVVAVARPLSLQVHPDAALTARWHAEEATRGVDPQGGRRGFADDVAKVEMVYALSEFQALCGFRPGDESVRWLDVLDVRALEPTVEALRTRGTAALHAQLARLLRLDAPAGVVAAVGARAGLLTDDPHWGGSARVAARLAAAYPDDPAVLLALLLRPLLLAPGSAVLVPPGRPHTYLSGVAFEVQANSDNVVRAGLTDKHVDVDLLLETVDTAADGSDGSDGVAAVTGTLRGQEQVFAPDTPRFALGVVREADGTTPLDPVPGPQILLCVDGEFGLDDGATTLRLTTGQSAYASASHASLRARGRGTLLRVTAGRAGSGQDGRTHHARNEHTNNEHSHDEHSHDEHTNNEHSRTGRKRRRRDIP